ncbi:hypothetical protein [Roseateles flavus]|uniref:Peptidase A2 domain-containing protein n=1 Tax=Roseateles flavus TaxID=3149041 RepID=A0ABV0GGB8_9BURK
MAAVPQAGAEDHLSDSQQTFVRRGLHFAQVRTTPSFHFKHPMLRIPITLARRPGYEQIPNSYVSPVISLTIAGIPEFPVGGIATPTLAQPIRALLDTGADIGYVDEQLLQRLGATSLGQDSAPTKSMHGERTHGNYLVNLQLPGMRRPLAAQVSGVPLCDGTRAYEAILGMEFLRLGRLVLDATGESYFELPNEG